jgi:repressor LexA
MTTPALTEKQLSFFRILLELRRKLGTPPTIRQLQAAARFTSPRSVTQFLEALERAGYIERGSGARNIRILRVDADAAERARTVEVPIVGNVAAGTPILAAENIEAAIPVAEKVARPPYTYFFLRVKGDSMNRAGIRDGSLALIRQQQTARNGDVVVALIDDEATVKRLRLAGGLAVLEPVSSNPKHKPIVVDGEFRVQGVVVTTMPDITK